MKRIGISFIVLLSMISCSWVDSKTKEDIDNKVKEAKAAIQQAGEEQVKTAKTRIEEEIASSVRMASDNIDTLVKTSISEIEKTVQNTIEKEVIKLESKSKQNLIAAVIGIILGLIGLTCAVISMLKLREAKFREAVLYHVLDSKRVREYISNVTENKKPRGNTTGVTPEDVRVFMQRYITDPKTLEYIAKQVTARNSTMSPSTVSGQIVEPDKSKVNHPEVQKIELYARDSTTQVLSDIFSSHQKGKTIYKLILDSSNSNFAAVDLCVDKEDAVGRILRFNNEDLESICTVSRNSDKPEHVRVLKKGKAEKVGNSEWKVIEKVEIELS